MLDADTFVVERVEPTASLRAGRRYHIAFQETDGPITHRVCRLLLGTDGRLWAERRSTARGNVPLDGAAGTFPKVAGIIVGRFIFEE